MRIARRIKDLTNLETIVTPITKDRHRRIGIIKGKVIVTIAAVDIDTAIEIATVINTFDHITGNTMTLTVDFHLYSVDRVRAEQEVIDVIGSENVQRIDRLKITYRQIIDIDHRRACTCQSNIIKIRTLLTVEIENSTNTV